MGKNSALEPESMNPLPRDRLPVKCGRELALTVRGQDGHRRAKRIVRLGANPKRERTARGCGSAGRGNHRQLYDYPVVIGRKARHRVGDLIGRRTSSVDVAVNAPLVQL